MAATHRVLITDKGCMDAVKGSKEEIDPPTADLILRHSRGKDSLANAFAVRQMGRVQSLSVTVKHLPTDKTYIFR
jgi:hypothetical protein